MELHDIEARKKIKTLKIIKTDPINWKTYYVDPRTDEKWIEDRPQSGYHGGGRPRLRLVEKFPWEKETPKDLSIELDRLFRVAFNLQERASEALWAVLKNGNVDPTKLGNFKKAN